MGVTALVMAGGRGTRMKLHGEKPLIRVGGKAMIEYVINALRRAKKVDDIVVAVSKHTPKTAERMRELSIKVLETPGEGYVSDIQYATKKMKLGKVLTISADLPLITSEIIDYTVEYYERCGKPALAVMSPIRVYEELGLKPEYRFEVEGKIVSPIGLNIVDSEKIDEPEIEEEALILNDEELAININTIEDLKIAEQWLCEKSTREELIEKLAKDSCSV